MFTLFIVLRVLISYKIIRGVFCRRDYKIFREVLYNGFPFCLLEVDMRNKKGQFYLIAAIFIVLILFGTNSVATYALSKPEPRTINDISEELNRETYKIIEHGIVRDVNLTRLIEKFSGKDMATYVLKNSEDAAIVFVYGNKTNFDAIAIENQAIGKITVGGAGFTINSGFPFSKKQKPKKSKDGKFLELEIKEKVYKFEIKENEMFYFLIVKDRGDEVFIERNKEDKSKNQKRPGGANRNNV